MHRSKSFYVGQWQIEPALNRISCDDEQIQLVPKVMALLLVLVEYHGEPLSQDKLIELVWPGQVVSDSSVYQAIAQLRKALGDSGAKKTYIERVSGKGYRLIAPINEDNETAPAPTNRQSWLGLAVVTVVAVVILVVLVGVLLWWVQKPQSAANDFAIDRIASITLVDLQTESTQQFAKLDALNQVLLTQLMQIQAMKVVHHHSPDKRVDTQVVMTGKINQQDALIRVYLQMQLAQTGEVIWAQLFEGQLDNLFALQDNIVDTLLGLFKRGQVSPAFDRKSVEQRSFDQYLLARHLWGQRQVGQLQQAQQIFESMRQREQLFPLAAVGLCNTYHFLHIYSDWTLAQALEKCQPLLEQALKAQPDLGQALAAKAMLLTSQGEQLEALALFEIALKKAPNYAFGYMWYGNLVRDLGHYDQAL
ncbi:MAG: winged helix-turn-helix domain-containing protein, partial [Algicola sp.]|nr:winged helix-turn-helix domain-containing protein [Algicola sp.]